MTFSYRNTIRIMKYLPVCPWPKAVGLSNIPRDEPTIFVYNHITKRAEPVFLALAAPSDPPIRFVVDVKVAQRTIVTETLTDVRNSVFSPKIQEKWGRHALLRKIMESTSRLLTRFLTANISGYKFIPVFIHEPASPEEAAQKRQINRQAFKDCIRSLENHVPVAIAPSGGYTHQRTTKLSVPTTLPSLSEILQKRGKTLKIVPCIVKERPLICQGTYIKYIADRILPYRLLRLFLDRLRIQRYERPRLTVEFLPPVTFLSLGSGKNEKINFVRRLQQIMYDVLNRD